MSSLFSNVDLVWFVEKYFKLKYDNTNRILEECKNEQGSVVVFGKRFIVLCSISLRNGVQKNLPKKLRYDTMNFILDVKMNKLDLRKIPCPRNSSKALIFLSTLESGEVAELLIDDGEPIKNVPSSLEIEGHKILKTVQENEGYWILTVVSA